MADYPSIEFDLATAVAPALWHWEQIDRLREQHRFFWNQAGNYWVLTRYDDIREAFQNPGLFSNRSIRATEPDPPYRFLPSFIDPPQHMKYRHTMNRWFAPHSVAKLAPAIGRLAYETIASFAGDGHCDFTSTFADAFPVKVFLLAMGLPPDHDADFFVSCVRRMSGASGGTPEDQARMMSGWNDISAYWRDLVAERRARPGDPDVDFVSHLMLATVDGQPLPDDELLDIMVTLTLGSLDTMKSQLGWCFYHLASHDDDRRRLVAEPALVPAAVEEFLRVYPIVSMGRKLNHDVDFHGCPMKKDQMVLLTIQAATRDPRQFPDADKATIDRTPNHHIAFGASEHRCLGSHLARNELQTAIVEWHRVIPEYRLAGGDPPLAHGGQIALLSLPLEWEVPS
jgi:cytochrome P450